MLAIIAGETLKRTQDTTQTPREKKHTNATCLIFKCLISKHIRKSFLHNEVLSTLQPWALLNAK